MGAFDKPRELRASRESTALARGRDCYARRAWAHAFEHLTLASESGALEGADLERLATAAYLIGRDPEYLHALERAYHAHLDSGAPLSAARCVFWLGLRWLFRGEAGHAGGWFARAERLLNQDERAELERGYLLLPAVEQCFAAGDLEGAHAAAARAAEIGERFAEVDLIALARHLQGHALIRQGWLRRGIARFDEAMLTVASGGMSPIPAGLVYCGVLEGCQHIDALDRAREWTHALARWCEEQSEMVAFTGRCQVHRAEVLRVHGDWPEALVAARRAMERCRGVNARAAAEALYQEAELHRLRGDVRAAEQMYRAASDAGYEPQPGLALLRLAQRDTSAALAAMRRLAGVVSDAPQRAKLLPAYVEILLAAGELEDARAAALELQEFARAFDADVLSARAAQARGAVELFAGDARAGLAALQQSALIWQRLDVPYEAARVRALIGQACRALGDEDGAVLALEAARACFEALGAKLDLAAVESLLRGACVQAPGKLSARELQVLRLVAAGKSNKQIAAALRLSEKTVERHLSNIFNKLAVSSRAAATAYAYEHALLGKARVE